MFRNRRCGFKAACLGLLATTLLAPSWGCVGMMANLIHVARGNLVAAKYRGLEEQRVAVVCVSNSEAFGPTSASVTLAREVGRLLEANVDKIQLVDPQVVADWIDENGWDYLNYLALGKGVNAEKVLAIDLDTFSLHEGGTLYKGRADISVTVYDLTEGKEVYANVPAQVKYPMNSGYHTAEISETTFRRQFLSVVASQIARQFYAYDVKEDYARDVTLISN